MTDKQLIKLVASFTKSFVKQYGTKKMCYAVCAPLLSYLSLCGVRVDIVEGEITNTDGELWAHFWLRLPDGRILDPTANQFTTPSGDAMPQIYIGEKPHWYKILILAKQ